MDMTWSCLNKGGKFLIVGSILSALLSGCGGGGSSNNTTPPAGAVISGTAAGGAPIVGTVSARDSKGTLFGPVTIGADGKYSLSVNGGVAPFIVEASSSIASHKVHSIASTNGISNLNITPITDMVVAQATGMPPDNIFNNCTTTGCAIPAPSQVTLAETHIKTLLADLMTKFGVAPTTNLLTDALVAGPVAGQSPIDKMMDAIVITPVSTAPTSFLIQPSPITGLPATTVLVTVPAPPSGGVTTTTVATAPLAVDPSLTTTVVTNTTNALTSLQGIQSQFAVIQGLFATALPSPSNPTLLALFDASFNNWGQNKAGFISNITSPNGAVPGITFTNVVAAAPRPAPATQFPNDATHQWFTFVVKAPNQPASLNGPWLAIYDSASAKWLVAGNQMPAPSFDGTYTSSTLLTDANTTWTHVEKNTVSGGVVNINHTYTSVATSVVQSITGQDIGTGLALTIDPADPQHATFTGPGTIDNFVVGGLSNLRAVTMTGELWVQNDGSINMYWSANDPLSNMKIGGCSSTSGAGCPTGGGSAASNPGSAGTTTGGTTTGGGSGAAATSSGIGSWYMNNDTNMVITFFANGDYMQSQSVTSGLGVQPGLEHGTFTYNASTGAFATGGCPPIDTNGQAGLSHTTGNGCGATTGTVTVNGNTLTFNYSEVGVPTTLVFNRVIDAANPLVGSWYMNNDTNTVITFFANGNYMHSQSVVTGPVAIMQPGIEHGTYTWNSGTGAFATGGCPPIDTNGQAGFSHTTGNGCGATTGTMTVSGNTLTFNYVEVGAPTTLTFSRVQ